MMWPRWRNKKLPNEHEVFIFKGVLGARFLYDSLIARRRGICGWHDVVKLHSSVTPDTLPAVLVPWTCEVFSTKLDPEYKIREIYVKPVGPDPGLRTSEVTVNTRYRGILQGLVVADGKTIVSVLHRDAFGLAKFQKGHTYLVWVRTEHQISSRRVMRTVIPIKELETPDTEDDEPTPQSEERPRAGRRGRQARRDNRDGGRGNFGGTYLY